MGIGELLLLAVGVSMDAFAVSICKGLAMKKATLKASMTCGLWFGGFQALMPVVGYIPVRLLGPVIGDRITALDHWVAFAVLGFLGGKMIYEALKGECEECVDCSFAPRAMVGLAVATSIDALAVGVTFALNGMDIVLGAALIGLITFVISALGVKIGNVFGIRFKRYAEFAGGVILALIGLKILLEHLGVLAF
jgi:putative Mn2+ efflux pump MntP